MRLKKIKLYGSKAENGELDIAISLDVFVMEDERSEKTTIRRLLDKKVFKLVYSRNFGTHFF